MSDFILRFLMEIVGSSLQWTGFGIGRTILKVAGVKRPTETASVTVGTVFWIVALIAAVYYWSR
ncbi:MAG TPA: hypothetical protein VJ746_04600 [Nitrospira sp.]|nr:hypothetical protein [Nitrospira sp.]